MPAMSNCIQFGDEYCPFRWEGEILLAWVEGQDGRGEWLPVRRIDAKNGRGEWIFRIITD
jgi:hypothetical protein